MMGSGAGVRRAVDDQFDVLAWMDAQAADRRAQPNPPKRARPGGDGALDNWERIWKRTRVPTAEGPPPPVDPGEEEQMLREQPGQTFDANEYYQLTPEDIADVLRAEDELLRVLRRLDPEEVLLAVRVGEVRDLRAEELHGALGLARGGCL